MTENINPEFAFNDRRIGGILQRSYRNPPIVEALCEVYFSGASWDETLPERFFEEVKQDFPKKEERPKHKAEITLGESGAATTEVQTLPSVFQFLNEEGHRIIQVSENLLVVNQLQPYCHFEEWEEQFYKALDIYMKLASPDKIERIGLRYINRFEIPLSPEKPILMADYFAIFPTVPQSLGKTHGPFLVRMQVPQNDDRHTLLIVFGTEEVPQPAEFVPQSDEGKQAFMLDIYDIASLDIKPDKRELSTEIRLAHENVVKTFEDSITNPLRQLLGVEEKA